jgi:hypothetical protein
MKKGGNPNIEKMVESSGLSKSFSVIKFNLSANNLDCFKGKDKPQLSKSKCEPSKDIKCQSQIKSANSNRDPS